MYRLKTFQLRIISAFENSVMYSLSLTFIAGNNCFNRISDLPPGVEICDGEVSRYSSSEESPGCYC